MGSAAGEGSKPLSVASLLVSAGQSPPAGQCRAWGLQGPPSTERCLGPSLLLLWEMGT